MITVALDAMGGDNGVQAAVEGAARLSLESAAISILLVGDVDEVSEILASVAYDPKRLAIVAAEGSIAMDEDPKTALKEKPNCSVIRAAQLVRDGRADALVSAGNTGGLILASSMVLERIPGIKRAALAAVHPTEKRHGPKGDPFALMLDVGATISADAEALMGFALMGTVYSSIISEIDAPRVALLSNGTEAMKGTPHIIEAHQRLRESHLNFVGNVEGLDIPRGTVDVIVCDGFLGNVVLKMLEGVWEVFEDITEDASSRRWKWKVGMSMLKSGLRRLKRLTDWKVYGGAPVLGLNGVVIKAHGRSEARAIRNALKVAAKAVEGNLTERIRDGVENLLQHAEGQ